MHKNVPNIPERQFRRLIDGAPTLLCPNCSVAMTIRTLVPVVETNEYRATYRCPQCGRDGQRAFNSPGMQPTRSFVV